jgi:hypothetical protein
MDNKEKLTVKVINSQPVELEDFTISLFCLAGEYNYFIVKQDIPASPDHVKLYIKNNKDGCIEIDLFAMTPAVLPLMEHACSVIDFCEYLKRIVSFLIGNNNNFKDVIKKTTYENLSKFLEPFAKDNSSQINISATTNGDIKFIFGFNGTEAKAAQKRAIKALDEIKEPIQGEKYAVSLYWYPAINDPGSKAEDMAVIESIHKRQVKVMMNDEIRSRMLSAKSNIFRTEYIVDVNVQAVKDKPTIYEILKLEAIIYPDAFK